MKLKVILILMAIFAAWVVVPSVQTQQIITPNAKGESTMNASFKAKRIVLHHSQTLIVPPAKVFPLLCPVLEYDWIDGWNCEMVYTDSGVIENNCIFITNFPNEGREVWVTNLHDPEHFRVEFVRVAADFKTIKYEIQLHDNHDGTTHAEWTQTITALSEKGNEFIDQYSEEKYQTLIEHIEKMLNHYFKTGTMLKKEDL